jgi:hypothetical protein
MNVPTQTFNQLKRSSVLRDLGFVGGGAALTLVQFSSDEQQRTRIEILHHSLP